MVAANYSSKNDPHAAGLRTNLGSATMQGLQGEAGPPGPPGAAGPPGGGSTTIYEYAYQSTDASNHDSVIIPAAVLIGVHLWVTALHSNGNCYRWQREIIWTSKSDLPGYEPPGNVYSSGGNGPELSMAPYGTTPANPFVYWIATSTQFKIRTNGFNTGTTKWFVQAHVHTIL